MKVNELAERLGCNIHDPDAPIWKPGCVIPEPFQHFNFEMCRLYAMALNKTPRDDFNDKGDAVEVGIPFSWVWPTKSLVDFLNSRHDLKPIKVSFVDNVGLVIWVQTEMHHDDLIENGYRLPSRRRHV